ncbi:MAG TPA: FecR domain-containing protein [Planctomycetota bacterium]|nr:FecR domain-containing protein [Planctomycetota bacterium]
MSASHDDLVLGYLDGSLSPEEIARLDEALRSDPALGARFARLALLEGLLPELAAEELPEPALEVLEPAPVKPTRRRLAPSGTRRALRTAPAPLPWGKIAAGVLLGLAALFFMSRRPEPKPEPPPVAVRKPAPEPRAAVPTPAAPAAPVAPQEVPAPAPAPTPETPAPQPLPQTPTPTPAAPPPPEAPRPRVTQAEPGWAVVTRSEGSVTLVGANGRTPLQVGAELRAGDALETAGAAALSFRYPDGTLIEAQPDTSLADASSDGRPGKTLRLSRGSIAAQVATQPPGTPFVIQTPQATATVVGTALSLSVTPTATRLDVREGRVRLSRKSDNKSADVAAGQFAVAGPGAEPRPQLLAKKPAEEPPALPPALFRFDFEDGRRPELWEGGVVEAGPKRDGSKFCLNADKLSLTLGGKKPLALRYSDDLVLSFDHWVAPPGSRLSIRLMNASQNFAFTFTGMQVACETWSRFSMPIKDMFADTSRRFRDGDRISSLTIFVESRPKAILYVDNLEVIEKKR